MILKTVFYIILVVGLYFSQPLSTALADNGYKSATLNLEIQLPPDWKVNEDNSVFEIYSVSPGQQRARIRISKDLLGVNNENVDLERLLTARINFDKIVCEIHKNKFELISAKVFKVNSYNAIQYSFSAKPVDSEKMVESSEATIACKTDVYVGRVGYRFELLCCQDDLFFVVKPYMNIINSFHPII